MSVSFFPFIFEGAVLTVVLIACGSSSKSAPSLHVEKQWPNLGFIRCEEAAFGPAWNERTEGVGGHGSLFWRVKGGIRSHAATAGRGQGVAFTRSTLVNSMSSIIGNNLLIRRRKRLTP